MDAGVRERLEGQRELFAGHDDPFSQQCAADIRAVLAEVDGLRAELAAMTPEAWRAVQEYYGTDGHYFEAKDAAGKRHKGKTAREAILKAAGLGGKGGEG